MLTFPNIIGFCWIIFLAFWVLNWRNAKPTLKRSRDYGSVYVRLFGVLLIIIVVVILRKFHLEALRFAVLSPLFGVIGSVLAVIGLTIAILARRTLGRNWSGNVELKKGHTLTTNGIYGIVRHPIYLGMFLMMLGTLVVFQSIVTLLLCLSVISVFIFRINREEKLMMKTFPKEYPKYKKQVKALIPYIW